MTAREFNTNTLKQAGGEWDVQDAKDGGDVANYDFTPEEMTSAWALFGAPGSSFTNNARFEVDHDGGTFSNQPSMEMIFNLGSTFVNSEKGYLFFPGVGRASFYGDFENKGIFTYSANTVGKSSFRLGIDIGSSGSPDKSTFSNSGTMYIGDKYGTNNETYPKVFIHNKLKNTGVLTLYSNAYVRAIDDGASIDNETGGTINGSTRLAGTINHNGGTFNPGNSAGGFSLDGTMSVKNDSIIGIELGGVSNSDFHITDTEHDFVEITGDLIIDGGNLDVSLIDGFELALNQQFDILKIDGELTGTFNGLEEGAIVGSLDSVYGQIPMNLFITYEAGDGNDIALYTADNLFGLSNI